MGLETALIIGGVSALAGGATSFMQARQQQEYAEDVAETQQKAIQEQINQVKAATAFEREKAANRAHLIRSKIRAAAGESGIGFGGSYNALMRQAALDARLDMNTLAQNALLNIRRAKSSYQPVQEPLSPILSGALGGLGGLTSGLSIASNVSALTPYKPTTTIPYTPVDLSGINPRGATGIL